MRGGEVAEGFAEAVEEGAGGAGGGVRDFLQYCCCLVDVVCWDWGWALVCRGICD